MKLVVPFLPKPIRWIAVLAVAGFLFCTSVITAPPAIQPSGSETGGLGLFELLAVGTQFAVDKWRHFAGYGVLACTLAYAIENWELKRWCRALSVVTVGDAVANGLGATLVVPWYALRPYVELRSLGEVVRSHSMSR